MKPRPLDVSRLRQLLVADGSSRTGLRWRDYRALVNAGMPSSAARRFDGRPAGCVRSDGRSVVRVDNTLLVAPRVALALEIGKDPGDKTVDHKDVDSGNNSTTNLRPATALQQAGNKVLQRRNKSGAKGVGAHRLADGSVVYRSSIGVGGRGKYLGSFDSLEQAAAAYDSAATEAFGEFAMTNKMMGVY